MIRYLEEIDTGKLLSLMELVKDDFAGYDEETFVSAMRRAIAEKEALVIYEGEDIAGAAAFSYKNNEITFLAVNPNMRRKGIAKLLITEVIGCFRPGDMIHVVTFRDGDPKGKAAVACYKSCCFKSDSLLEAYGYPCQKMLLCL